MTEPTKDFQIALIRLGRGLLTEWEKWLMAQAKEPKKAA
jgi:hypothetical protein